MAEPRNSTAAELDRLWLELRGTDPALAGRPNFRRSPAGPAAAPGRLLRLAARAVGAGIASNLYRRLSGGVADLDARIAALVTEPRLRVHLEAQTPGAAELACELIALGPDVDAAVSDFSAAHYLALYPDLANAGIDPFQHFLLYGQAEGRRSLADLRADSHAGARDFDPDRPTCLICLPDLSDTDAPRVGLRLAEEASISRNVVLLAARGGPLLDAAIATSSAVAITARPAEEFDFLRQEAFHRVDFAVLNTVESYLFAKPLVARAVPFATWLHEYPGTSTPGHKALFAALFPDLLAFSSETLRAAWQPLLDTLDVDCSADTLILSQEELRPGSVDAAALAAARAGIGALIGQDLSGPEGAGRRLVYGAGLAQWRKGTDLFAMTALAARDLDPRAVFVWIGEGVTPNEAQFGVYLDQHLRQQGVGTDATNLFLLPAGEAYGDLAQAADVMFLSSRLDPLPGVVFDAVRAGAGVVLFRGATGFDDARYGGHPALTPVPFGDLAAAARAILALPRKTGAGAGMGPEASPEALPVFARLATALQDRLAARPPAGQGETAGDYDVPVMFSTAPGERDQRRAERAWLWARGRRFVWASARAARAEIAASDSWIHKGMVLEPWRKRPASAPLPRFNIHMHAYYTEGLAEDLRAYLAWRHAARIVVTTDQQHKARRIATIFAGAGLAPDIRVVANRGRDVAPFLDLLREAGDDPDALWCHLHHKKAPETSVAGDVWRAFLMTILLGDAGGISEAVDRIATPGVGLVAAFDPYDTGWAGSRRLLFGQGPGSLAELLARHLPGPLPHQPLLFPTGQMFWTRAGVARAMADLFGPDHPWPNEPLADDGTVLHAIERLWPALTAALGLGAVFLDKPDQRRV